MLAPRIAPASRLTSFRGYQPAVCGHPTGMILTRAHRSSDLLRKRALPGGYFTRALYAVGQNHAGPANVLALAFASGWFVHCTNHRQAAVTSGASRLSGLCASLRPSFGAATTLRLKTKMQAAKTSTVSPRVAPSGAGARRVFLRSICARRCPIDSLNLARGESSAWLILVRHVRYNIPQNRCYCGKWQKTTKCKKRNAKGVFPHLIEL